MAKKILKSSTIVPSHLYVERDADRQVREIIDGMGRPGYVLVARQMGKTNLLLNAKRRIPKIGDVFLYLDISSSFPDLRSFFRNIIDVAIDVGGSNITDVSLKIQSARVNAMKLPHKEHEWELREILKAIPGRLIVCLDEIDAIAGVDFSGQVFSFIRSTYFSGRSNFPEFERLTYLLSGVAEPSEIIKNRDVSPFNIGEKIYLSDFSRAEFNDFLSLSGIGFESSVADRIFYWTNGHPRMTWDVCSALEGDCDIGVEKVDSIVCDLYFSEIGVPPLDHIKKLVEDSREIRDAIMSIHYKRTGGMLDSIKTKLYLAGVSGYSAGGLDIVFKNKILENSLSEEWVFKLEQSAGGVLLDSCLSMIAEKNYAAALPKLIILVGDGTDPIARQQANFFAGLCCFHLGNFDQALEYLGNDAGPKLEAALEVRRNLLRGVLNYRLNRYQSAVAYLSCVSNMKPDLELGILVAEAKIYLAAAIMNDGPDGYEQIIELCESGLSEVKTAAESDQCESLKLDQLRGFAALTISSAYSKVGLIDLSKNILKTAISESYGYVRSVLHLAAFEQYYEIVAFDVLLEDLLVLNKFGEDDFIGANHVPIVKIYPVLSYLYKKGRLSELEKLIKHIFVSMPPGAVLNESIVYLGGTAFTRGNRSLGLFVVGIAVDVFDRSLDLATKRELWSALISFNSPMAVYRYGQNYVESYVLHPSDRITSADLNVLFLIIMESTGDFYDKIIDDAMSVVFRDVSDADLSDSEKSSLLLVREFLRVRRLVLDKAQGVPFVQDLLRLRKLVDGVSYFDLSAFPANFLSIIRSAVLNMAKSEGLLTVRRSTKKIGRNDFVRVSYEGRIERGKFKKFANDIAEGVCQLVD